VTQAIEREIHALEETNQKVDVYEKSELIETIEPKDRYLAELRNKVDTEAIGKSGLRIAMDPLYGTARDYLDYFLLEAGVEVKIIHNYRDPYFGGFSPECNEKNLGELRNIVTTEHFDLGLATDGDADRFGIIDDRNRFVSPNIILALLALYLKRTRNIPGGLARSVATTSRTMVTAVRSVPCSMLTSSTSSGRAACGRSQRGKSSVAAPSTSTTARSPS